MYCRAVAAVLPGLVPGGKKACGAKETTNGAQDRWGDDALYTCADVGAHCGLRSPESHLGKDNAGRFELTNDKITRQNLNIQQVGYNNVLFCRYTSLLRYNTILTRSNTPISYNELLTRYMFPVLGY